MPSGWGRLSKKEDTLTKPDTIMMYVGVRRADGKTEYWTGEHWDSDDSKARYFLQEKDALEHVPLVNAVPGVEIMAVPVSVVLR